MYKSLQKYLLNMLDMIKIVILLKNQIGFFNEFKILLHQIIYDE